MSGHEEFLYSLLDRIKGIEKDVYRELGRQQDGKNKLLEFNKHFSAARDPTPPPLLVVAKKIDVQAVKEQAMPPKYKDGSFRVRSSGILEYRFMHLENQKSVYGKSESECWDKRTNIINGKTKNKKLRAPTLYEWLLSWYDLYKKPKNGEKSLESIKTLIEYINAELGSKHITKITSDELQQFINKYSDRPNTQKKLAHVLRGALEKARVTHKVKYNEFEAVELVAYKAEKREALQFEEQRLIFDSIDIEKYKQLFFFCCCTGVRINRVLALETKDFDTVNGDIIVLKKQRRGLYETYRVPYLPELLAALPPEGKIFPDITYNSAKLYFYDLFAKLKIKSSIHCFRHTFISVAYFLNVKEKQIQEWAGHNTLDMTMNVYTHLLKNGTSPILEYMKKLKRHTLRKR